MDGDLKVLTVVFNDHRKLTVENIPEDEACELLKVLDSKIGMHDSVFIPGKASIRMECVRYVLLHDQ